MYATAFAGPAEKFASELGRSPTNIFAPVGTQAHSIFGLSLLVIGITTGIFLIVASLLLFAIIRYRHHPSSPDADYEPAQIYGSNQIELSWTVIPVLVVVMLFLATARIILATERAPKPDSAINIKVIGHQFWWEFRYPKYGVVTANELHIPVSDPKHPTPAYLTMTSADVDHSFWVPKLAGKTDLIPNRINVMWLDAPTPGIYLGQCAQYCGTQHAKMLIRVYADTPEKFAAWIAHQKQPAVNDPAASAGETIFMHNACINCHTVAGTAATGRFGPDLTHVASRDTLASGSVTNNEQNMREWVNDPAHFKPGALMPPMHLSGEEVNAVTTYLMSLK